MRVASSGYVKRWDMSSVAHSGVGGFEVSPFKARSPGSSLLESQPPPAPFTTAYIAVPFASAFPFLPVGGNGASRGDRFLQQWREKPVKDRHRLT